MDQVLHWHQRRNGCDLEFVAKFGELWEKPRKYKSHTSAGIEFALVEGLSHELESVADRFIMSILRGRCGTSNDHPVLKLKNKTDFPGGIFPGGNLTRIMLTKGF